MSTVDPALACVAPHLAAYVAARRWFRGKARGMTGAALIDAIPLPIDGRDAWLGVVRVTLSDGTEDYALPLRIVDAARAAALRSARPHLVVCEHPGGGAVIDALGDERALGSLLTLVARGQVVSHGGTGLRFRPIAGRLTHPDAKPRLVDAEQSNTSVLFGDSYILKIIRKLDDGASAELEMGEFLTRAGYAHAPPVEAAISLTRAGVEAATVGILHRFVANRGDAWAFFLDRIAQSTGRGSAPGNDALGEDRARVRLLATRVAEMHVALASRADLLPFAPEPIHADERARLADSVRTSLRSALAALASKRAGALPGDAARSVASLLSREQELYARLDRFVAHEPTALKTRVHGDLHLGQILVTQDDFVLIDFEGEPARSLAERKAKRSPLVDVAGLLRSFDYAAVAATRAQGSSDPERIAAWSREASRELLNAYFAGVRGASFLPARHEDARAMLDFYLLEKCIYEVHYELNNRPDWVAIPLAGLSQLIEGTDAA